MLLEELAKHGLSFREWTTVAGGESSEARVDQILAFVNASGVDSWAVVDDEDWGLGTGDCPALTVSNPGPSPSFFCLQRIWHPAVRSNQRA